MAAAKPSIEALLESFKATGKHELADLEARLGVIFERYEEVRTLNPQLFASPLLDDVVTAYNAQKED